MGLVQHSLLRWTAPDGPWTEPDLHLFPQDGHRYEIVDGSLHVTPPVGATHERIVGTLVGALRAAAPPGWWICARLGVQLRGSNLVPDVAVLRPGSSGAPWNDPRDVALVVEVETPATRRFDALLKPDLYAEAGIPGYWRIAPTAGRGVAHVYRLDPGRQYRLERTVQSGQTVAVEQPFPLTIAPAAWTR